MHGSISRRALVLLAAAAGLIALAIAFTGSLIAGAAAGLVALGVALLARADRGQARIPSDPSRRRFLATVGAAGLALVAGGTGMGRALRRLVAPDPRPALEEMARGLGAEALELVRRTYHPGRSGDLQLLLAPFSSSNYPEESLSLVRNDPRTSHASVWPYLERVPIVVYAPGTVAPGGDSKERVTLADLAPTAALLMGFDFAAADGRPLPRIEAASRPPKLIVTFVIDGGGWNVLSQWPDAWPNLRRLMRGGIVYRDAIMGSFPAVTACAHATIGTGAFPRTHGITGHNLRHEGRPVKAYGEPGTADPSFILVPTLADAWNEHTGDGAWVGEFGYQVWHLGMLGRGGAMPLGEKPVAVFWDELGGGGWKPQNPELYRLPKTVPPRSVLDRHRERYRDPGIDSRFDPEGRKAVCCTPPIIRYQGDLIEAAFDSEPVGADDVTDLLYINYKAPDYAGHIYNMLSMREKFALGAVDRELGRLVALLEERFAPGEFALIVAADHGQCPTPNVVGGVRLDPIQLGEDIERAFGRSIFEIVSSVVPSEVYLDGKALWDAGVTREDIAAFLKEYRYRENIGPYVSGDAIERDRLDQRIFAA
ncbi:MAG: alkaline phosphatase family protein, partial [Actinomycetota bacterium]